MSPQRIVPQTSGYRVTPYGLVAMREASSCQCVYEVADGMLICRHCFTGFQLTRPQAARVIDLKAK